MSVQFLKDKVDSLGFTVQKATWILTYKKRQAGRTSSYYLFFFSLVLVDWKRLHCLPAMPTSCSPPYSQRSLLLTPHPDLTHPPLSLCSPFTYLIPSQLPFGPPKRGAQRKMLSFEAAALPRSWCQPRAPSLSAAVWGTVSGQQRSKPYGSALPCHYWL